MRFSLFVTFAVAGTLFVLLPLEAFGQTVADLYRVTAGVFQTHVEYHQIRVPKGQEVVLADLKGPGKITYFYITEDTPCWYAGLVLKVFWDNETEPSVLTPLADFFGAMGGKTLDYQSALLQINHGCHMSYLPMPFSHRARFVLANDGERDYLQTVAYGIDYEQSPAYSEEKSRLHCAWRRSNPVKNGLHTIVEVRGRGHYIGNVLEVFTKFEGWWGEGDTIFQLDGNALTHTPGTEEEYGSCWGFGHTYSYSYSGYLENANGHNRMYRWYVANPVRFQHDLKVEIQNQHANGTSTTEDADEYTSVAFWYQEEPHQALTLQSFGERTSTSRATSRSDKPVDYHSRGDARQNKGDRNGAIADYTKAIELNPHDAGSYSRRGDAKQGKNDLDGAIADYPKAIELAPDDANSAGFYSRRGDAKRSKNNLDGAIADYTRAIELAPDDANSAGSYSRRGDAKRSKNDLDGAISDYTKAIELAPDDAGAYFNRSLAKEAKGDLNGASADRSKANEHQPVK